MTYTVTLNEPGDFYEFTINVVNDGTIDAVLSSINLTELTAAQQKYITHVVTYNGTDYYCRDFRIFAYCPSLEEVVLISTPGTEFILPNSVFEECTALKTVDMSQCDNLVLCDYVFRECSSLQKLDLPDSTKPITQRISPFYNTSESLVVTYKGKEYNYTNFDEMFN
jgi:hypothetical protein